MLFNRKARRAGGHDAAAMEAPGEGMRRVGAELGAARERLGWSLADVAAHLRIREPFLEAIEQGRIDDLPGPAYALGFVRTYARTLGLDQEEITRRCRAEADQAARRPELAFPAPMAERGVPAGAVVLLGAVLAVGAYVGWYRATAVQPGSEPVQPVPERLADLAVPPPAPPAVAPPPVAAPAEPVREAVPRPTLPPSSAAAAVTSPPPLPAAAPPAPPPAADPLPEGTRIVLRARTEAWIQVRDRQGQVLFNRVLRPGETWPIPAKGQFLLTTGNAGGTELLVDGQPVPTLGGDGVVRRDIPLDPDLLRDGRLAQPVAAARPPAPRSP